MIAPLPKSCPSVVLGSKASHTISTSKHCRCAKTRRADEYCLRQLGLVDEQDHKSLIIRVFWRSCESSSPHTGLNLRGQHGVWGLDDYHFLLLLFGSVQLRTSTGPTN
ncbi:hypothetical protein V8E55_003236 [Tylopilus felleus]